LEVKNQRKSYEKFRVASNLSGKMIVKMEPDELITFRVQYLLDSDPLSATTAFPIPVRAPTYAFTTTMPLATQLGTILRLLNAPQSVRIYLSFFFIYSFIYKQPVKIKA